MLDSPFRYEEWLTDADFQKLGQMSLRWSHIEHVIGNCLRVILRLSMPEATAIVFPLSLDRRLDKIKELSAITPLNDEADAAFRELYYVMKCVNYVRNNVVHAILVDDPDQGHVFHLRSKDRSIAKEQIFSVEELTNYAAHAVLSLRFALGMKGAPGERHPLPDRPEIPEFLRSKFPEPKKR